MFAKENHEDILIPANSENSAGVNLHGLKICVVSPDAIGPVDNGGVGTHATYLAQNLAAAGAETTLVFTGLVQNRSVDYWTKWYSDLGIEFVFIDETWPNGVRISAHLEFRKSYNVYTYLKERDFDQIHFQDWQANGLVTIMAKRSTHEFSDTLLSVTMHSSTEWIHEGMRRWLNRPLAQGKIQWSERYCCQFCDLLVSPSQHMFDWAQSHGWKLNPNKKILRYCMAPDQAVQKTYEALPGRIAFFGRLETRKGLEIFCNGLQQLDDETRSKIKKLEFLGKIGTAGGESGKTYIRKFMKKLNIPYSIKSNYNTFEAVSHLRQSRPIVFVPSLLDNYPFVILESICFGLPVLAAKTGGIPEMLSENVLFEGTAPGVRDALKNALNGAVGFESLGKYHPQAASREWTAQCKYEYEYKRLYSNYPQAKKSLDLESPLVSVCVSYYNYGKYFSNIYSSLLSLTYENKEIVFVDDGSTDPLSRQVFDEAESKNSDPMVRFLRKQNGGPGSARNWAADRATGEFLIFVDADNFVDSDMIEQLLIAQRMTDADIVTCYLKIFQRMSKEQKPEKAVGIWPPLGPAMEIGWLENVFGDTNFLVKSEVFRSVGGFSPERHIGYEDWEFLARANLMGYSQIVVPKCPVWYRSGHANFVGRRDDYQSYRNILDTYSRYLPSSMTWLFPAVAFPYHIMEMTSLSSRIRSFGNTLFPAPTIRGKLIRKIVKKILV